MDPIWYTIRIVATGIMTAIGGLLLWMAYLVAGNVNGAAISWMVLLGLEIPIGFFAMFTLVGWQRSTAPHGTPNAAIAWCNDRRRYPLLLTAFVVLLFGSARQIVVEIRQGDAERADLKAYEQSRRLGLFDPCWVRAGQAFSKDAGTAGNAGLRPRLLNYCVCLDLEVEKNYTPLQFAEVPKDRWWAGGDAKIDRIVQKCRIEDSGFVRAVQTIRKNGGNPESEMMEPKVRAYTACVKVELESGYNAATLMMVSTDPAWQDADGQFRQIIARCMK